MDMPLLQVYCPANPCALHLDHDYLEEPMSDNLLRQLKIVEITADERQEIEHKTRGQVASADWLEERCHRLQALNFGKICRATDKTDFGRPARDLCHVNKFSSKATRHGQRNEKHSVEEYERLMDCAVERCGIFVSDTIYHNICTNISLYWCISGWPC